MTTTSKKTSTKAASTNGNGQKAKTTGQAQQIVDSAVGTYKQVADEVAKSAKQLRNSETRTAEIESLRARLTTELEKAKDQVVKLRAQVTGDVKTEVKTRTDDVKARAEKARKAVEQPVRDRVEPVYRERVAPVVEKVRTRS